MTLHLLVVSSETPGQMAARRARAGQASHETFAETLRRIARGVALAHVDALADDGRTDLTAARGILFAGSPIQMHEQTPETHAAARFMERVFASGTPSYGSCAGLQIATVGAGGTIRPRAQGMEAGFARGLVACLPDHPLLAGRGLTWDALAMHASEVDRRPDGMTVLAATRTTPVEAAEIRSGPGIHWGVQYHPELTPSEIAGAVRASAASLVEQGTARDEADAEAFADRIEALGAHARADLAWQMGVQPEIASEDFRTLEVANFLAHLRERT